MNQPEYEQKKRECWEEFMRSTDKIIAPRAAFSCAFDRAYAFGKREKDAEGEEMLTVLRKKVQELNQNAHNQELEYLKQKSNPTIREEIYYLRGQQSALGLLFGSKCLPDEACNVASSDVASSKPKPAEPKEDHFVVNNEMVKDFDTIIKDGFSKEWRLNIATQMVKAIMQCPEAVERIASAEADSLLDDILHDALYLTDRLMSECEKGGSHEKA